LAPDSFLVRGSQNSIIYRNWIMTPTNCPRRQNGSRGKLDHEGKLDQEPKIGSGATNWIMDQKLDHGHPLEIGSDSACRIV
jgi:hypothetical protein